jgi:hypothetical protein
VDGECLPNPTSTMYSFPPANVTTFSMWSMSFPKPEQKQEVSGSLTKKREGRRFHLLLRSKRWHLLPPFFV